jgi:hypothetical protein
MELGDLSRQDPVAAVRLWYAMLRFMAQGSIGRRSPREVARKIGAVATAERLIACGCPLCALALAGFEEGCVDERVARHAISALDGHAVPSRAACVEAVANMDLSVLSGALELAGVACHRPDWHRGDPRTNRSLRRALAGEGLVPADIERVNVAAQFIRKTVSRLASSRAHLGTQVTEDMEMLLQLAAYPTVVRVAEGEPMQLRAGRKISPHAEPYGSDGTVILPSACRATSAEECSALAGTYVVAAAARCLLQAMHAHATIRVVECCVCTRYWVRKGSGPDTAFCPACAASDGKYLPRTSRRDPGTGLRYFFWGNWRLDYETSSTAASRTGDVRTMNSKQPLPGGPRAPTERLARPWDIHVDPKGGFTFAGGEPLHIVRRTRRKPR